ncbi:MAG: membrane protein insertase YidC [Gammaproteobacteria bacterium]
MDNLRLILLAILGMFLLLLWQAWQRDYGAVSFPVPQQADQARTDTPPVTGTPEATSQGTEATLSDGQTVSVRTDVFDVTINKQGGVIQQVKLIQYPVAANTPGDPFVLLTHSEDKVFIAQSGLKSTDTAPDHQARYESSADSYQLGPGQGRLEVPLTWRSEDGVEVSKVYVFTRGRYLLDIEYDITNRGTGDWTGRQFHQLQRGGNEASSGFIYTYTGVAISTPDKPYEKYKYKDLQEKRLDVDITGGWAAILQHYFVTALVPDPKATYHYYSKILEGTNRYLVGLYGPEITIAPGETGQAKMRMYMGPKIQAELERIAPHLELTVDYGWLWFIGKPIFWALDYLHGLTGNWGVAILLITLIIKLLFFQLSAASYKSMARMKRLQPRLEAIRERLGDDKMAMNQAIMDLYKAEKVNPFGGCLPIFVQVPVFIALYWVLLETVEMRQAPFGWIQDLSIPDPWFILPLVMGISMFIQYKLNPTPVDPVQQKVFQILPIAMSIFFAFFPAGLVLYWVANNILSITQQWFINRRYGEAARPVKSVKEEY